MTIESDSGYSPMALAVALGHKKSKYQLYIIYTHDMYYISDMLCFCRRLLYKCLTVLTFSFLFSSSESAGGPYSETLQTNNNTSVILVKINKWRGQCDTVDTRSKSSFCWWLDD